LRSNGDAQLVDSKLKDLVHLAETFGFYCCSFDVQQESTIHSPKIVDERNQRVTGMEHKLAMLEVECATFNQELQESQARQRREQKWPNEEAVQTAQCLVGLARRGRTCTSVAAGS